MTVARLVIMALLIAESTLPRCHADILLDFKSSSESFSGKKSEGGFQVWIGDHAARLDLSDSSSYIVNLREKQLLILDHIHDIFHVLTMPVRLEQYLDGEGASNYDLTRMSLRPTVKLDVQGSSDNIGKWRTELYVWSIVYSPTYNIEMRSWLSRDLKIDETLFNHLISSYNALKLDRNQWIARVLEPEGVAVRTEVVTERYQGSWTTVSVLESLRECPATEDRYRAPTSYTRTEFDGSRYAVVVEGSH